ncbi:MAG TPA: hypothetical protein VF337_08650 [Candidatus Limnocylindrales bacterium]
MAPYAPVPTACSRCGAPIYYGQLRCTNCGLDAHGSWATLASPAPARSPILPIAIALVCVACLAVAGALLVVSQNRGSAAAASPSPVAIGTSNPTPASTETPALGVTPSAGASAPDPTTTAEPSPDGNWTSFTDPDGLWTVRFPGSSTPTKTTSPIGSASDSMTEIIYGVSVGGAGYAVAFVDLTAALVAGEDNETLLTTMQTAMVSGLGGTDVVSTPTTEGDYPARDVSMDASSVQVNIRIWFVGTRFYMLLVSAEPGAAAYPQHFFAAFTLK